MNLKSDTLKLLLDAGIPLAGDHSSSEPINFVMLHQVIKTLLKASAEPKVRDAVISWVIALRDHYPSIYKSYFLDAEIASFIPVKLEGRHIKLRRLALSHLGKIA